MVQDDDDSVIDTDFDADATKRNKIDQLASARVKAVESRRKSQAARLETKLHHVRELLGENPKHVQHVLETLLEPFIHSMRAESNKLLAEASSVNRHVDLLKGGAKF